MPPWNSAGVLMALDARTGRSFALHAVRNLPPTSNTSPLRRYVNVAGFVVVWMAAGHFFHWKVPVYFAVGSATALLFHLFVARRPWLELWMRDASDVRIDGKTTLIALVLAAAGVAILLSSLGSAAGHGGGPTWQFLIVSLGAIPAAIALRQTRWRGLRAATPSIVAFYAVGWLMGCLVAWIGEWVGVTPTPRPGVTWSHVPNIGADFLINFLYAFLVEEVVFRGVLDPYVAEPEKTDWGGFRSALFVALLWGIWHLPMQGRVANAPLAQLGLGLHILGIVVAGVPLAYACRRSRTLALPAALHALGNAWVVNVVL